MMGKFRDSNQLSSLFFFRFYRLNSVSVGRQKETHAVMGLRAVGGCRRKGRRGWASMCLKYVSLQLCALQLKRRWGVCLAATPKDCYKPINTTPAPTSPPTQMMSAFIRRVVIPPLAGCEAAAVPYLSLHQKPERRQVDAGFPTHQHHSSRGEVGGASKRCHVLFVMHAHTWSTAGWHFGTTHQMRKCSTLQILESSAFAAVAMVTFRIVRGRHRVHPGNLFLDFKTASISWCLWKLQEWSPDQKTRCDDATKPSIIISQSDLMSYFS